MDFRNRKLVITVRTLFGLLMIFSGASGLLMGQSTEGVPANMIAINQALWASGILQMIKVTEAAAGLMLLTGFLPALAAIFIAPIAVGIIVVNGMLMPQFVIAGIIVGILDAYLGYVYWDKYRAIFQR